MRQANPSWRRDLWRWAWVWLAALALAAPAMARTVLDLDTTQQPVQLKDWGDAWMDLSGQARVDEVVVGKGVVWTPTREGAIYPLGAGQALWVRFTIPPAPDAERWYLEIPYPSVNLVTLYTLDGAGRWQSQSAGDSLPVAEWPVPHRHPLLPVAVSAEEPRHYLLQIRNPHSFSAPLNFVSEGHLSRSEQRTSLILGIYFGLAGLAAMLAVLSAVSLRDSAYGVYALSVTLMGLSQAAMTGIGGLHLWPHLPWWNDVSSMVLPTLAVGSLLWFFSVVVSLPERSLSLHRLVMAMAWLAVAIAIGITVVDPTLRLQLMAPYIVVAMVLGPAAIVWSARRGDRFALWLLFGSLPVIIGGAFPLARAAGLIPVSVWTVHGMQLGIAIELPVLLLILMVRSQQRREHQRRIQKIERIDPATGLINGEVFAQRLARLMARAHRLKYQGAVLLIDVANTESIRRQFGARAAEELPLQVAGRLLGAAREIDAVARLSQHRFALLLEGPLSADEAAAAGQRVVARCLMPFKSKPIEWVAQVRVAQTLVPLPGCDAGQVIDRLEALLASIPPDSKRAVFSLKP